MVFWLNNEETSLGLLRKEVGLGLCVSGFGNDWSIGRRSSSCAWISILLHAQKDTGHDKANLGFSIMHHLYWSTSKVRSYTIINLAPTKFSFQINYEFIIIQ